jgi:hypothetical protein
MSFENLVTFTSEKDGCVYFYDDKRKMWMKICPVASLPLEIRQKLREEKNRADQILELPEIYHGNEE